MSVTNEQVIAFIAAHPEGVTSAQVGDHFKLLPQHASNICSKLGCWGLIDKKFIPREKINGVRAVWKPKP